MSTLYVSSELTLPVVSPRALKALLVMQTACSML